MRHALHSFCIAALVTIASSEATAQYRNAHTSPIRTITKLRGQMTNTVTGVGLVTGLNDSGSSDRATRRAMANLIRKYNLNIDDTMLSSGSIALVTVTAELPSFAKEGQMIDVQVQTVGGASSINSGFLMKTPLSYGDGMSHTVFVEASGTVGSSVGVKGKSGTFTLNNPTTGIITRGGRIVEDIEAPLTNEAGDVELVLLNPSIETAFNISAAISAVAKDLIVGVTVHDESMVVIKLPEKKQNREGALEILFAIGEVHVTPVAPINVTINQATGTIIAGAGVQISPCVIAKFDMTISIIEDEEIVQPNTPFTRSRERSVNRTHIDVEITPAADGVQALRGGGATVEELLANLNQLDLKPRQLIDVFRELSHGHYLHAPLNIR